MENKKGKQCDVCMIPYFERNNYFHGKLMTVRDFFAEQCYFNEKRWLINRMVNGWGVVCGLDVVERDGKVIVTPGLAIDCCGREILVCEEREVELVPQESQCEKMEQEQKQDEKKLIICLEFRECKTEPISLPPIACDQKENCEFNRIRDSFKITVHQYWEEQTQREPLCPQSEDEKEKNLHQYLCDKLRQEGCPECLENHCVILAIVTLGEDGSIRELDQCSRRRLVYSNSLLYDLVHCFHGDLPHVIDMNWKENGAQISWKDFENNIYDNGLTVNFDKEMNGETINTNTFLLLVKMEDPDTGNYAYEQVPGAVSYAYNMSSEKSLATFIIDSPWLYDVYFGYSRIKDKGGEFMVVLKSDFIMSVAENDKPGKALDGNFIGGELPSGNGTQGGDFESWFFVEPPKPKESNRKRKAK